MRGHRLFPASYQRHSDTDTDLPSKTQQQYEFRHKPLNWHATIDNDPLDACNVLNNGSAIGPFRPSQGTDMESGVVQPHIAMIRLIFWRILSVLHRMVSYAYS